MHSLFSLMQGMIAAAHAVQIKLESERVLEKAFSENKVIRLLACVYSVSPRAYTYMYMYMYIYIVSEFHVYIHVCIHVCTCTCRITAW